MGVNPYQIVLNKKNQRTKHRLILLGMKFLLIFVVIVLLGEPLQSYVMSGSQSLLRLEQLIFRTAAILVSISALQTYTDVVRHPERHIFGVHPVRSRDLLWVLVRGHIQSSLVWLFLALGRGLQWLLIGGCGVRYIWFMVR